MASPPPEGGAVDGADDGYRALLDRVEHLAHAAVAGARGRARGRGVALAGADGALQVGAGAEGAFPGSREDGHVDVEVVGDGIEDPHDVPVGGEGIDGWVVERDNGDVVLDVDVDGHGRAPSGGGD